MGSLILDVGMMDGICFECLALNRSCHGVFWVILMSCLRCKKRGGVPRAHYLMQNFRDVLDHCGFVDLGFFGPDFTWHGRRRGEWIWERLDRSIANYKWLTRFPTGRVKHLNCFTSDHWPLLLSLDGHRECRKWRRKPFWFEAMWISDPKCEEVVARAWDCAPTSTPMFVAATKLKRCKKRLKS